MSGKRVLMVIVRARHVNALLLRSEGSTIGRLMILEAICVTFVIFIYFFVAE